MDRKKATKRALIIAGWIAGIPTALIVLVLITLMVTPARERVLDFALGKAGSALPGDLTVAQAAWPSPGTIEAHGFVWVDGADTLAAATSLSVTVDLFALLKKDIHITDLTLAGAVADVAAIGARFPPPPDADDAGSKDEGGGFPRAGSLPPVPSLAADRVRVDARYLRLGDGSVVENIRIAGAADLLHGGAPVVRLEEVSLEESSTGAAVDSLRLVANLATLAIDGNGVIRFPAAPDVYLVCSTSADREFDVRLSTAPGDGPPRTPGVSVTGRAVVEKNRLHGATFEIRFLTPGTGELAGIEPLARYVQIFNDLDGVGGHITGRYRAVPATGVAATVVLLPNNWLDSAYVDVDYDNGRLAVDSLVLALPGLRLRAAGETAEETASKAAMALRIDGTRWLTNILADVSPPDSLSATVTAEANGYTGNNPTGLSIRANGFVNGFRLDSLLVSAEGPQADRLENPWRVDLEAGAAQLRVLAGLDAWLNPAEGPLRLRFRDPPRDTAARTIYPAGELRYDPAGGGIVASAFRLAGAAGDITVNAELDSALAGRFDVTCSWPDLPDLLYAAVSPDSAVADSVGNLWREDGPFVLAVSGRTGRRDGRLTADVDGRMRLPGPRDLLPLFSPGIPVDDLGPLEGVFSVVSNTCGVEPAYEIRLDLEQTAWLDTARVELSSCGTDVDIDTALVAFEGLRISASGARTADIWDLRADVALADSQLVRRLEAATGTQFNLTLESTTRLTGPADDPLVSSDVGGGLTVPQLRVPVIAGRLSLKRDSLFTDLALPDGFTTPWVVADSGRVAYTAGRQNGGLAGGDVKLEIRGPSLDVLLCGRPITGGATGLAADTFYVNMSGQDIASRQPFAVRKDTDGGFSVESLELAGSIGFVSANGSVRADTADFDARAVVTLPPKPESIGMADRLWPDTVLVDADFENTRTFTVRATVSGFNLAVGVPVDANLRVVSDTLAARAQFDIDTAERTLFSARANLPGYSIGAALEGPLRIDVLVDDFPVPTRPGDLWQEEADVLGRLDGEIAVRGTAAAPEAAGSLLFTFARGIELGSYNLAIEAVLANGPLTDSSLVRICKSRFRTKLKTGDTPPGASVVLALDKAGRSAASVDLLYPLHVALNPFAAVATPGEQMSLRVRVNDLAVNDLDPLLPPDLDLAGGLSLAFDAAGDIENPSLDGSLKTRDLTVKKGRIAQIAPDIDIAFGGSLSRPAAKGEINLRNGVLRVPEPKTELLPGKGSAVLWDQAATGGDTLTVRRRHRSSQPTDTGPALPEMDLDIGVKIPESFRITGNKLQMVMAGDLRVNQKGRRLSLTGELTPREGHLLILGRSFKIRRGAVYFYGGDELNPSFDLTLTADVSSYKVEIKLTGTMEQPKIEMTSDPALSESDIASLLLFGQPMSELNSSQSGLLQQRTAEILLVFGAAKLQQEMGEKLGVDIVSVGSSTRKPEESALIVGKYLNTRTLLKYEQNLDDPSAYLINLEYYITKRIKLETFIDQLSNTGAEINWTKDY